MRDPSIDSDPETRGTIARTLSRRSSKSVGGIIVIRTPRVVFCSSFDVFGGMLSSWVLSFHMSVFLRRWNRGDIS